MKNTVFKLRNKSGMSVAITNFGGRIMTLSVPDRSGKFADVVLGYNSAQEYLNGNPYFGAIIGRYGNRIAGGRFQLNGKWYSLTTNDGSNTLHGGPGGFHNVWWTEVPGLTTEDSVSLYYRSPDGEEGYPGNLEVTVRYSLTDDNALNIDYTASTDAPTIINLTSHGYFNLAGEGVGDILDHALEINADYFTPVNNILIQTGERKKVSGTAFDFRHAHAIGDLIDTDDDQLRWPRGYDHNWVLNKKETELSLAARVTEPLSGRCMEVYTTEPGIQFYSGNFLEGKGADVGKEGKPYPMRSAFCLEAQHFPDSPNHPEFPSVVLRPGDVYHQKTIYKFGVI